MRFASRSKQIIDPDTLESSGPSPAAFVIRPTDKGGLSVTWVEHFGEFGSDARARAAFAHRETLADKRLPPQGLFTWASVSSIVQAGAEYRKGVRVVHDPVPGNSGHAEIRHFTDEDLDLLEFMSSSVFTEFAIVRDMGIAPREEG